MKKIFSVVLCIVMVLQVVSASIFVTGATAANNALLFEDNFNYDAFDGGAWTTEYLFRDGDQGRARNSTTPSFADGTMKFTEGDGIRLDWQKLSGFSTFDTNKTYTLTFDAKITSFGDDIEIKESHDWNRELYFAFAGWYNQIEFRSARCPHSPAQSFGIRAGGDGAGNWTNNTSNYSVNNVYTCTVVWKPSEQKITSTVTNGTFSLSGTRIGSQYSTLNMYTQAFAWRCEDGSMEIDNVSFTDGTNTYTENFNNEKNSASKYMTHTNVWSLETVQKTDAVAPTFANGVLKLGEKSSVNFNWTKISGIGEFNADDTYVFEFDVTVTDSGDGSRWGDNPHHTRALYVGFGGYYTFLSLPDKDGEIDIAYGGARVNYQHEDEQLHVKMEWQGKSIYIEVSDSNGKLGAGTRTSDNYVIMDSFKIDQITDAPMTYLTLRCEDGAVDIDNFEFGQITVETSTVNSTPISVPDGKQAEYECKINYEEFSKTVVSLGDKKLFSISDDVFIVGERRISGDYMTGIYTLKAYINPTQKMVSVEVIMPDGGVVRRGMSTLLGGTAINVESSISNAISDLKLSYLDISVNEYTLTEEEPVLTGVEAKIYNVVTSFNESAATTRNFAWTVDANYFGNDTMAVKYRIKGSETWTVVDAVKEVERVTVADEDYFKCDVKGLTANTEYEYKIGKKNSSDETNDWSKTYSFKTAQDNVDEFSFIAIGDTQGITWAGNNINDKGFKYALAAYQEAFEEISNPAFIMHAGDVVEDGNNIAMWNWYFKSLGEYGTSVPLMATMGNHDAWIESDNFFFGYHFNHPDSNISDLIDQDDIDNITDVQLQWIAQNADETIYSYNYGDVHFISLNSGAFAHSQDKHMVEAQREWLINDLEANKEARWTIIFQHQPVYHRLGGESDRNGLADIIEDPKYGVDLVIQGHSHLNTRSYPMANNGEIVTKQYTDVIPEGTGTIYTNLGSTALNHDGFDDVSNVEEMFSMAIPDMYQPAYTTVKIDGNSIVVTTKQLNGLVLDTFTIGHDLETQNAKDATCGEEGYTGDKVCSCCGETFEEGTSIPATGDHSFLAWTTTKPATATEAGEKTRTCIVCSHVEVEEIAMLEAEGTDEEEPIEDNDQNSDGNTDTNTDTDTDTNTGTNTDGNTSDTSDVGGADSGERPKSGCGSSMAACAVLATTLLMGAAVSFRRKKED